jgi:hypothetical protein
VPSINRYVPIHSERRLRLNTCEGHVGIADEQHNGDGKWKTVTVLNLSRENAEQLIAQLSDQMAKHY